MALQAHGVPVTEDQVNAVLGAQPKQGASWEMALATLQYFGLRGTLVIPATLQMVRDWTDQGLPVLIGWNPEGRPWSHASMIVDVDDTHVHVADPNCPDPEQTIRVVPRSDFYSKWAEKVRDDLIIRRPALVVTREVTSEGRQTVASTSRLATLEDRWAAMGHWGVISAAMPAQPNTVNKDRMKRLEGELRKWHPKRTSGRWKGIPQDAFLVRDPEFKKLIQLASQYKQEAFGYGSDAKHLHIYNIRQARVTSPEGKSSAWNGRDPLPE
jgi:hypothetical protein